MGYRPSKLKVEGNTSMNHSIVYVPHTSGAILNQIAKLFSWLSQFPLSENGKLEESDKKRRCLEHASET